MSLRRRVEALLKAETETVVAPDVTTDMGATQPGAATSTEGPSTRVGPYELVRIIGAGGMGMVWVAEQEYPRRREVALRIIKPETDSGEVIARLEAWGVLSRRLSQSGEHPMQTL
ncbi:MAG: hypothetical protein ABSH47_08005 [Bryobacteraceae bacterium]